MISATGKLEYGHVTGASLEEPHLARNPSAEHSDKALVRPWVTRRLRVRARVLAVLFACLQFLGAAQQKPPVFRSEVAVVSLDISVLDRDRRPIRGLTADDFTILVDGVAQPIVAFSPVVVPPTVAPGAPWMRDVAPDVRTNHVSDPRLFVIIMDDATTPANPYMVRTGKEIARAVVDRMGPGDFGAVLFTMNRGQSQEVTADRASLYAAIDRFGFGFAGRFRIGGPDLTRPGYSVGLGAEFSKRTIGDAVALLRDHPQGRNILIIVSDVGPDVPKMLSEMGRTVIEPFEVDAIGRGVGRLPTIYYFSHRGLEAPGLVAGHFGSGQKLRTNPLETLADTSGGRASIFTNAPADDVPVVFEENSAYYLVGYQPTYPIDDGRSRRLQVEVDRPGARVFPDGQLIGSPKARRNPRAAPSPLFQAMADLLPQSEIPLRVSVAPFAIPRTRRGATAAVAVTLGLRLPAPAEPLAESVEVLAKVLATGGKEVTSSSQEATIQLMPATGDSDYELLSRLELKPGRYQLRYSVHAESLGKTGSVYVDVVVPDFTSMPVAFSGMVVSTEPAAKAGPADALAGIVPVIPTTERTFSGGQHVQVFVRVYQGGRRPPRGVEMEAVLTDARGEATVIRADRLSPEEFGERRAADYTVPIPVSRLTPGPYLFTLRASVGSDTANGHVRFTVR